MTAQPDLPADIANAAERAYHAIRECGEASWSRTAHTVAAAALAATHPPTAGAETVVTLNLDSAADATDLARALDGVARPATDACWHELAPAVLRQLAKMRTDVSTTARAYRVGDLDPTPDGLDEHCEHPCAPHGPCTWAPDHAGQHVAGSGDGEVIGVADNGGTR